MDNASSPWKKNRKTVVTLSAIEWTINTTDDGDGTPPKACDCDGHGKGPPQPWIEALKQALNAIMQKLQTIQDMRRYDLDGEDPAGPPSPS